MANQVEIIKNRFDKLIQIYQGIITDNTEIEPLKEIMNIVLEHRDNSSDFCKIIKKHLKKEDTPLPFKSRIFHIIDSLFKSDAAEYYIKHLSKYLYDTIKECFTFGNIDDRVLLFKIFYTWKYIIPSNLFQKIYTDLKIDDFKEYFNKNYPGKIEKYDEYNIKLKEKFGNNNFQQNEIMNKNKINNNLNIEEPKNVKPKKLLTKKRKNNTPSLPENENTIIKKSPIMNAMNNPILPNINIPQNNMIDNANLLMQSGKLSLNELKLYRFLTSSQKKINKNLHFFSSIAKYYNDTFINDNYSEIPNKFQEENNNEQNYQIMRKRMREKLFIETNKNNCVICGFKSLFYLDLIQHLDIHFYCNYLKKEGKNLFRKKANNKNNWIYGDGGKNTKNKNLEIDTEERKKNGITLVNLIFYRNMMNNNLINISNEQEEDDEEFMYPINDENRKVCHYCGDEFKKVFSAKYNYWFYNKVVVINDEKKKFLAHQDCFEELAKKFK